MRVRASEALPSVREPLTVRGDLGDKYEVRALEDRRLLPGDRGASWGGGWRGGGGRDRRVLDLVLVLVADERGTGRSLLRGDRGDKSEVEDRLPAATRSTGRSLRGDATSEVEDRRELLLLWEGMASPWGFVAESDRAEGGLLLLEAMSDRDEVGLD